MTKVTALNEVELEEMAKERNWFIAKVQYNNPAISVSQLMLVPIRDLEEDFHLEPYTEDSIFQELEVVEYQHYCEYELESVLIRMRDEFNLPIYDLAFHMLECGIEPDGGLVS